ncbi:MAG: hypothetical protein H6578_08295 [Chitinophagales bacterium]|nr:hypothetical protein [Chitinophagales bacterium]
MASIKRILKQLVDAIIFSNTWISLGALSLFLSLHIIFNLPVDYYGAITLFTATFIAYNLLKLNGVRFESNDSIFFNWLRKYKYMVFVLLGLAFISFLYCFYHLTFWQQGTYLLSSFLAVIYFGIDKYNLRKYSALKVPIVAIDWALLIVYSTLHLTDYTAKTWFAFLAVYFLIAGLTIPFEIRDEEADTGSIYDKRTLLNRLGAQNLKILSVVHIALALSFFILIDIKLLFLLPFLLIVSAFILKLNKDSKEYAYTFILDGVLVFVCPLVYLLYA